MCFYHEPDWHAEVYEDAIVPGTEARHCIECDAALPVGEPRRHIWMQQLEECRRYYRFNDDDGEDDLSEHPTEECPEGCDFGETFECSLCLPCCDVLEAIRAVELAEGCREHESQPALGELRSALRENAERDEDGEVVRDGSYLRKAVEMFPEIRPHLKKLVG